jgi:hypothetical protein
VSAPITRGQLLARSAKGGAALLVAGSALGTFVETAAAALPVGDLAWARLLVGAELLASDFYTSAQAAGNTSATVTAYLKRAYANEQEHYQSVGEILTGAGATPAAPGDFDFNYPNGTFASQHSITKFAGQLETLILGSYLGAIDVIQTDSLKSGLARVAANEAQHCSYFTMAGGGKAFTLSFPPPLTIDQASNALDAFTA